MFRNLRKSDVKDEKFYTPEGSTIDIPTYAVRRPHFFGPDKRPIIAVIHAANDRVTFSLFTAPDLVQLVAQHEPIRIFKPQAGWFEQEPYDIMVAIYTCCRKVCRILPGLDYKLTDIVCIGITNQPETTVIWNCRTGKPLYRAICWNDIRAVEIVERISGKMGKKRIAEWKSRTGLPLAPYFSAFKMRWLIDNVPAVREAIKCGVCRAGTVDTWIAYNLTKCDLHVTDVTNASRTFLMNLDTLQWDPELLKLFAINPEILPEIRSNSEIYGYIDDKHFQLHGLPISAILVDQQASLMGQMCLTSDQASCNYGDGCFLLCNTGSRIIRSSNCLVSTVAYQMGPKMHPCYALEGSIAVAGSALHWLQHIFGILPGIDDAEYLASQVQKPGKLTFVPAFTGLFAPYWRSDARGLLIGLTQRTTKAHIICAAFESICFQVNDILECLYYDAGILPTVLYADGKLSQNRFLMQRQADIIGIPVVHFNIPDAISFGTALCAGHADEICLCSFEPGVWLSRVTFRTYIPKIHDSERQYRLRVWQRAIQRSMGWTKTAAPTTPLPSQTSLRARSTRNDSAGMSWRKFLLFSSIAVSVTAIAYMAQIKWKTK